MLHTYRVLDPLGLQVRNRPGVPGLAFGSAGDVVGTLGGGTEFVGDDARTRRLEAFSGFGQPHSQQIWLYSTGPQAGWILAQEKRPGDAAFRNFVALVPTVASQYRPAAAPPRLSQPIFGPLRRRQFVR